MRAASVFGAFFQHTCGKALAQFVEGFVVEESEGLQRSIERRRRVQVLKPSALSKTMRRRMRCRAPEEGVHAAAVAVGAGAGFPFALDWQASSRRRVAAGKRSDRRSCRLRQAARGEADIGTISASRRRRF